MAFTRRLAHSHCRKRLCQRACSDVAFPKLIEKRRAKGGDMPVEILPVPRGAPPQSLLKRASPLGLAASCVPKTTRTCRVTAANLSPNGHPSLDDAYQAVLADSYSRFQILCGRHVMLQFGHNDYGDRIRSVAELAGVTASHLSDNFFLEIQSLRERLAICSDSCIRTSSLRHKEAAEELWTKCRSIGDIYLDAYKGWYSLREDRWIDDQEALGTAFVDPLSNERLLRIEQPTFFFRLSKYCDAIINLIENSDFLKAPEHLRVLILTRLKRTPLQDVPVSRFGLGWGVHCPDAIGHVMHVKFEGLARYLIDADISSFVGEPILSPVDWPADVQLVSFQDAWTHAVLWPAVLLSACLPLPKQVWVHGSFLVGNHQMSSNFKNGVNPHEILDTVPSDTLRWYLIRAVGKHLLFSPMDIRDMHDKDLRLLGNVVHRAMVLAAKYSNGKVPDVNIRGPYPFDVVQLRSKIESAILALEVQVATDILLQATEDTEAWLTTASEKGQIGKMDEAQRLVFVRVLLESVFVLAHLYSCFLPAVGDAILSKFSSRARPLIDLDFANLDPQSSVASASILFRPLGSAFGSTLIEPSRNEEATSRDLSTQSNLPIREFDMADKTCPKELESNASPKGFLVPTGLSLYLPHVWSPGILIRPASDCSMGDQQIVDERRQYNTLLERIRTGDQCLDIGGHIGTLTVALAEAADAVSVVAVEADPASCDVLRENCKWRQLDRTTVLHGALRARGAASTTLYRAPQNASVNSCVPTRGRDEIQVPVVTVVDVLQACRSPPTVIKMDIEGGEYEVLPMLLAACPELHLLSLELHCTKRIFRTHLAPALVDCIELFGFQRIDNKLRSRHQGVAELTHWERGHGAPRIPNDVLPSLLALWRHTYYGCMEQIIYDEPKTTNKDLPS